MDLSLLSIEVIKALRDKQSQDELSRKLGYSYNQVYRWEAGSRYFYWSDFIRLCRIASVPIEQCLREVFIYKSDAERADLLLKHILPSTTPKTFHDKFSISEATWRRWLTHKVKPRLEDVFGVLQSLSYLDVFLAYLFAPAQLPSASARLKHVWDRQQLFYRHPEALLVVKALQLADVQQAADKVSEVISQQSGLSPGHVAQLLTELSQLNIIEQKQNGYQLTQPNIYTQLEAASFYTQGRYWTLRSAELLNDLAAGKRGPGPQKNMHAFTVYAASDEASQKIRLVTYQAYKDIEKIIEEDALPKRHLETWVLTLTNNAQYNSLQEYKTAEIVPQRDAVAKEQTQLTKPTQG